ncbi:NAD(P)/FAD-dependent oxidoreductase [Allobranchiibius sp. GilTou73]|uniref:NAD(P)/FAD-dependent oxidoreductase n=1 Tax=Allobranchiibius sp. GilTou73 TaxID=2904523 RepID=UPI001F2E3C99|nr:geranylgeranyl reductase family protein [Allobranchiibius sp. GilTou73]UIJ36023.1 geranylgeranyl reductase family protein [Allobranchiibius sp. GilTou73]
MTSHDLVVVGGGPAGAAVALGALQARPGMSVALLDRADFPRDKTCGDGIAPEVFDLLTDAGVPGVADGWAPVDRLSMRRGERVVERTMIRSTWVIPRAVFDERLHQAAVRAGAQPHTHRVSQVTVGADDVRVDDRFSAPLAVGADGAHSVVRRAIGLPPAPTAFALRGYAPTTDRRVGTQAMVFGTSRQPSYAWSFDRGDGLANVGYGEVQAPGAPRLSRSQLLAQIEQLLPGSTSDGTQWKGAHLPLSGWGARVATGRVALTGDAAGMVNPMTGEGIYYAVLTGLLAGRAAAAALDTGDLHLFGRDYTRRVRTELGPHLRHSALAARLCRSGRLLDAGVRAAQSDQRVFDDLVDLGLANGRITPVVLRRLARHLLGSATQRTEHIG